jgi:hypothetical protein
VRCDGQKVLLAGRNMGGESEAAWRGVLDDLTRRGLKSDVCLCDAARAQALARHAHDVRRRRVTWRRVAV